MRIFAAVRHSIDPHQFYGGLWSGNFYPALRQLGHKVIESKVDLLPTSRFMDVAIDFTCEEQEIRARTTQRILDEVRIALRTGPIELFLSYFYNAHFDPAGFDELRQLGIPSVNFYCNSIYQFALVANIAAKVDFSWHAEREARKLYLDVGARPIWVQMAASPERYYPIAGLARQPKAVFVGQRYADRDRLAAALIQAKVPIDIYGAGWGKVLSKSSETTLIASSYLGRKKPTPGSMASYKDLITKELKRSGLFNGFRRLKLQADYRQETRSIDELLRPHAKGYASDVSSVLAAYELCVNFSNVWADGHPGSALIPHVRLRDFEGPMCRTCYLTGYTDELMEFYEVGREIETYQTQEELVEKASFYLSHPEAAEKLREAGYQRALREHTWEHRFQQLFYLLGFATNR